MKNDKKRKGSVTGEKRARPSRPLPRGSRRDASAGRAQSFGLQPEAVNLTKMLETLKPHDHLCLLYESRQEWRAAVVPFISIGLKCGEKCAYIIDTGTADEIRKYLREEGIDGVSAEKSGQLFILPETEAYTKEDSFDPDRMIALLIAETKKAIAEGYPALRVTVEMSWVLRGHPGSEKLLEYEAKLNRNLFPKHPCLAICQYDRWKFDPEIIKGIVMTHPLLIRGNQVYRNFYYIPPKEFLNRKRPELEVQHWLNNLEREKRMWEGLRQSEELYRTTLMSVGDGVITTDANGRVELLNLVAEALTGWRQDEAHGRPLEKVFHIINEETRREVENPVCRVIRDGRVTGLANHSVLISRDGTKYAIADSGAPIRNERNEIMGVVLVFRDQTAERAAREALREAEEKYRSLFEGALDAIVVASAETGTIIDCNRTATLLWGREKSELVGQHQRTLHPPEETEDGFSRTFQQHLREKEGQVLEAQIVTKNGEIRDAEIMANVSELGGQRLIQGIFRDITERKKAEETLRESETKYSTVVEAAIDGITIVQDGLIKFANKALENMSDYNHQEIMGKPLIDFIHPDDRGKVIQRITERIEGKPISGALEVRYLSKDGALKYVEAQGNVIQYNAKPADLIFIRDISERKKAEDTLRESEERFRSLYENSTLGLYRTTLDGRILMANSALIKMLGYSSFDELSSRDLEKDGFAPSYPRARFLELIEKEGEVRGLESAWMRKDWTTVFVRESARAERDSQGKTLYYDGTVEDITERIQAEAALRESEEKYRNLVESISDVIYAIDGNGTITYVSPVVKNVFGYEPDELVGRNFLELVHKEDQGLLMTRLSELREGNIKYTDYRMIDKQGDSKWVRTLTNPVIEKGVFMGARGALVDITERKKAEKKIAASLREKEVLLREIHHRVKNNMQIISSLLRLQSRSIEDEKMREVFNESQSRIRSMSLIHEKLYESKDFSRVDFSDYIGKMVTHLFVIYQINAQDVHFTVEAKDIHLDITKAIPCGLIINELVSNALKYAFPKGKKGELIIRMTEDESGKYHLSVKDTGIGLTPDIDIGKTATLGFQIITDLVRQLSGTIELKRDKGTEFRIVF